MAIRNLVLATGEIYHVFNRGVERRTVFTNKRDYERALETINYYRFTSLPVRYSHFLNLTKTQKENVLASLDDVEATIFSFCLMPNHFHFILKQEAENGISRFMANFANSYSRYFNTKYQRIGPLFQGTFKAVHVESDEQLLHLSRYVHLNPVSSFLVKEGQLDSYPWSSLPEYLKLKRDDENDISDPKLVLGQFKKIDEYQKFVHNQIDYAQELEKIKHLAFDD